MLTVIACGNDAVKSVECLNSVGNRKIKKIAVRREKIVRISENFDSNINIGEAVEKILESKGRMERHYRAEELISRRLAAGFMDTEIAIVAGVVSDERDIIMIENVSEVLSRMGILNLCVVSQKSGADLIQKIIFKTAIENIRSRCSSIFVVKWEEYYDHLIQLAENLHDLIHFNGVFNLNIGDFYEIFNGGKKSYFIYDTATGENRGEKVLRKILEEKSNQERLLNADNILINIMGNRTLTLHEIKAITEKINYKVNENASIIFGTLINDGYKEDIKISMIVN